MTIKELSDLRNEFGEELYVKKATNLHDERYGNKIEIVYKNIIVGSDLVSYEFVRENILKINKE